MRLRSQVRFVVIAALGCAVVQAARGGEGLETIRGKAMLLPAALKQKGVATRYDLDPIAKQVVVVSADGAITPLLSDDASRALFADERLRDRPIQMQARRIPGLAYVQVVTFKIEEDGRFQSAGYECDVCAIRVRFPQSCPCCQGPMILRMKD